MGRTFKHGFNKKTLRRFVFLSDRLKSFHKYGFKKKTRSTIVFSLRPVEEFSPAPDVPVSVYQQEQSPRKYFQAIWQNSKSHISLEKNKTGCSLDKIVVSDLLFKDLNQTLLKGAPYNCLEDNHDLRFLSKQTKNIENWSFGESSADFMTVKLKTSLSKRKRRGSFGKI